MENSIFVETPQCFSTFSLKKNTSRKVRSTCFMTDSLLLRTLAQLSAKERRALSDFVRCALFNRRNEVERLCDYLIENLENGDII